MGNSPDKEQDSKTVGDQTVTIIENQELHTTAHNEHEFKLNVILVLLVVQVLAVLAKVLIKTINKALAKAATKAVIVQRV